MARGFKQREGIGLGETFAPTEFGSSVRLPSAVACECDFDPYQFDVDRAFVGSYLEEDAFGDCRWSFW